MTGVQTCALPIWRTPPQQVTGQPRVREVELGSLGEPLGRIGPERAQQAHHAGGLQHREPALRRLGVDTGTPGEGAVIDEPARARGTGDKEMIETRLILDSDEIAYIPLKVGANISRVL